MPKYLIHAIPSRMWYVTDYLIPSMVEKGIDRDDISIWNDEKGLGCLKSAMKCFGSIEKNGSGTWHLQDDVMICRDFKKRTEEFDSGLVCGYCYDTSKEAVKVTGLTTAKNIWYSFPCIRIPNGLARDVGEFFFKKVVPEELFMAVQAANKGDDYIFVKYVLDSREDEFVMNLNPTLVAHVDYLIGGSIVNPNRPEERKRNLYFKDLDLINELEEKLRKDERSRLN